MSRTEDKAAIARLIRGDEDNTRSCEGVAEQILVYLEEEKSRNYKLPLDLLSKESGIAK